MCNIFLEQKKIGSYKLLGLISRLVSSEEAIDLVLEKPLDLEIRLKVIETHVKKFHFIIILLHELVHESSEPFVVLI